MFLNVLQLQMSDCFFLFVLLSAHVSNSSVFWHTTINFLYYYIHYFYYILACTHNWHTMTLSVIANVGAPEEEIAWTHNTPKPMGLCTNHKNTHTLCFGFILVLNAILLSDFSITFHYCTQNIDTNLKTHHNSVGLQRHSIYSAQVYTFFNKSGWCFCPLYKLWQNPGMGKKITKKTPHPPKEGFPKNCIPDGACQLRGCFVWKQVHAGLWHKMHNYCHHLTFFSFNYIFLNIPKKQGGTKIEPVLEKL